MNAHKRSRTAPAYQATSAIEARRLRKLAFEIERLLGHGEHSNYKRPFRFAPTRHKELVPRNWALKVVPKG
jgi:hypothetical protein